ncbi:hypothetical protein DES49_0685 [Halospina denitrificans]|uniref:Lipoprotein n=1 Tax=Halospina denitrificans TaxID=332522 RepID=A0A4R7K3J1_9GAMM|nr:hypothetical protein [Halospina denitrificans]TDT44573.1 hypothetical protein DES49_0685 [Halospina denitrificans]
MHRMLSVLLAAMLVGCASHQDPSSSLVAKEVRVTGFYVDSQQDLLLVSTTQREMYFFRIDPDFGKALKLSREILFKPSFKNFKLDNSNRVMGTVELVVAEEDLTGEQTGKLRQLGFRRDDSLSPSGQLTLTTNLRGKRGEVRGGDLPWAELEEPFPIRVEFEQWSLPSKAEEIIVKSGEVLVPIGKAIGGATLKLVAVGPVFVVGVGLLTWYGISADHP